jgi:hypothetical protein
MVVAPLADGVKVAVYTVLEVAEKLLKAPPETVISPTTKLLVASLEVKVTVRVPSFVVAPSLTALLPSVAVMVMVGAVTSITRALFAPNELAAPGLASVKVAAFPAASLIVPLFNVKADVLE